jgi:hypothetical protein
VWTDCRFENKTTGRTLAAEVLTRAKNFVDACQKILP